METKAPASSAAGESASGLAGLVLLAVPVLIGLTLPKAERQAEAEQA